MTKIGDYVKGKGIYAGEIRDSMGENPKQLFVALKDLPCEKDWDKAVNYKYKKGYKLPEIRELSQIYHYKEAINKGLVDNGGEKFKDYWYWSSTESYSGTAWGLHFSSGSRAYASKCNTLYVRPVLAL